MAIVAAFDAHRAQITFDALDTETGLHRLHAGGRRALVSALRRSRDAVAVEACTGWLFVCDALAAAGATRQVFAAVAGPLRHPASPLRALR